MTVFTTSAGASAFAMNSAGFSLHGIISIFSPLSSSQILEILVPFDGQGFIGPDYAGYINEVLYTDGKQIGAFQIRLPFAKGMFYDVDFHRFLNEYDENYQAYNDTPYFITDAFGIKRDLKKAQIILTKSMFKCAGWLKTHCKTHSISDPMQFYCNQLINYNHALYVSGTDLPYGHSKVTHLSYQFLNTLDLDKKQFIMKLFLKIAEEIK